MMAIYFLSTQNGEQTTKLSLAISEILSRFVGGTVEKTSTQLHMEIRKLAHIILFLGLGVVSYLLMMYGVFAEKLRCRSWFSLLMAFSLTAGYGYFDEWHKQFIVGRHFQIEEVILNIVSGCIGIIIVCGIQVVWHLCRRKFHSE